jgi:hypothetical protein
MSQGTGREGWTQISLSLALSRFLLLFSITPELKDSCLRAAQCKVKFETKRVEGCV